jgi:hypothetical protein
MPSEARDRCIMISRALRQRRDTHTFTHVRAAFVLSHPARAEGAEMQGLESGVGTEGHWDGSIVYFFTPANGVMLRRFDGYFDHNLRDRKTATTVNIVWKFR